MHNRVQFRYTAEIYVHRLEEKRYAPRQLKIPFDHRLMSQTFLFLQVHLLQLSMHMQSLSFLEQLKAHY